MNENTDNPHIDESVAPKAEVHLETENGEEVTSDEEPVVNAGDSAAVTEEAAPEPPPQTEADALKGELEASTTECEQLKDQLLRVRADFDNYRKRLLREMEQVRQTASLRLIQALLPALDNLERALAHAEAEDGFVEGVRMVHKQFKDALAAEGLEQIPATDEMFNPNVHDALAAMPSETTPAGHIMEEYERGYRLHSQVVRPARVIVSSGPPVQDTEPPEGSGAEQDNTTDEDTPSDT